jgi:heme-degrading monooxygenase HmoA
VIVTVFRFRVASDAKREFFQATKRMNELAASMPGYVSHKVFMAEDGEYLTHIEFESAETLRAWSVHPEHLEAKARGRNSYFSEYQTQICAVIRQSKSKPRSLVL